MSPYRYLNPFTKSSVHEDDVWGERPQEAFDVESIHADVSQTLLDELQQVAATQQTLVRFLIGPPGVGKSHLFSRLRRQLGGDAAFAFASLPPTRAEFMHRWVLERVVGGLQRPRLLDGALKPYTQLDALIYRLLLDRDAGVASAGEQEVHESLQEADPAERDTYLDSLQRRILGPNVQGSLAKSLMHVLRPETRAIAIRWLTGTPNLVEEELEAIGQAAPLDDMEVNSLLVLLGKLAGLARLPFVLVLDQLDQVTEHEQIVELDDLLISLIDQSHNWYVVIGLLQERYDAWLPQLSPPLKTRLEAMSDLPMPTRELPLIATAADKRELIERRLKSSALVAARLKHGEPSALFPLTAEDVAQLAQDPMPISPRALLNKASNVFRARVAPTGAAPAVRPALADAIRAEYESRRAALADEPLDLDRAEIADRVAEVVRLVALKNGVGDVASAVGPLEGKGPGGGTHNTFKLGSGTLHVVGHHMHRGAAFPNFAGKALDLPPGALFVRSAAAAVSGPKSVALLQQIRDKHAFVSLTAPMLADLEALAQVLAGMRAGDLRGLETDPPATDDAVLRAAAELPVLAALPVADAVRGWFERNAAAPAEVRQEPKAPVAAGPEPQPAASASAAPPAPAAPEAPLAIDPSALASIVRDIMRPLRWLAVERLRWMLRRHHRIELEAEQLGSLLDVEPCRLMFERHPANVPTPGLPQILIFVEDDHA